MTIWEPEDDVVEDYQPRSDKDTDGDQDDDDESIHSVKLNELNILDYGTVEIFLCTSQIRTVKNPLRDVSVNHRDHFVVQLWKERYQASFGMISVTFQGRDLSEEENGNLDAVQQLVSTVGDKYRLKENKQFVVLDGCHRLAAPHILGGREHEASLNWTRDLIRAVLVYMQDMLPMIRHPVSSSFSAIHTWNICS